MSRAALVRAVQLVLLLAVLLLPLAVHAVALYLACAGPCVLAAGALEYWAARGRRR